MGPIYEVVSGQINLSDRDTFFRLHSETLLPIMAELGIEPVLLLITEVGRYGRFLDIYRYDDLAAYERLTDTLLADARISSYYREVGRTIAGSILVEIMRELPYAQSWASRK